MFEKPKNEGSKMPPIWAWLFIIACAAIPIIALGGAIPGAIGVGSATGCYQVARNESRSTSTNVAYCVGITVIAWGLFLGMLYFFSTMSM
jgi:hypothetical protein